MARDLEETEALGRGGRAGALPLVPRPSALYPSAMRIVFMGSGEFGLPTLRALAAAHEVVLVVTQPDRPAGRHRQLAPTPIGQWAAASVVPTIKPLNVNDEDVQRAIAGARADVAVVIAFGQYIRPAVVDTPRLGTVNLHGSLLPKYRGAAPINWAIINGERETGNTVIRVAAKMDGGDMLGQRALTIEPGETAGELHDRLAARGPDLVLEALERMAVGTMTEIAQDESQATVAPKLSRADGWVDFAAPPEVVRNRIHGLTPWPGVTSWWSASPEAERHRLMLLRVKEVADARHSVEPGTVIADGVIACGGGGAVRLVEVQSPGKRQMSWADYTHGHAVPVGAVFGGGV